MRRAFLEGVFQRAFANTRLYVADPDMEHIDTHGNPAPAWGEFKYLCDCDRQALQGEEAPSHRDGGNQKVRIYIPADKDVATRALLRFDSATAEETWVVVGVPRTQPEGHGLTQVTLLDAERYEG